MLKRYSSLLIDTRQNFQFYSDDQVYYIKYRSLLYIAEIALIHVTDTYLMSTEMFLAPQVRPSKVIWSELPKPIENWMLKTNCQDVKIEFFLPGQTCKMGSQSEKSCVYCAAW